MGHGRIAVLALLAVAAGGCDSGRALGPAERPTVRVLAVRVQDVQLDYVTLAFEVEVRNPSTRPMSVKGLRYGLSSGPNTLLSGAPLSNVTVPAATTQVLSLQDAVVGERFLRGLGARLDSTIPFTLELRLTLETRKRQTVHAAASARGQLSLPAMPQSVTGDAVEGPLDVIYIATPQDVVEKMLSMARVKKDDVVYDLGCGDGRVLVTAARTYGCRAVGHDLDPRRVEESLANVKKAGVGHLVTVEQRDVFTVDLRPADVVFIYLNPVVNRRLVPQLRTLKSGSRIVSHSFPIGDIKPDEVATLVSREDGREHYVYLWTTPLRED